MTRTIAIVVVFACCGLATGELPAADPVLRPLSNSDEVISVTRQGLGLTSIAVPVLIFAAWPDGRIIWSENSVDGGAPYRTAQIDPKAFAMLMSRFEKDGLFNQTKLADAHFGPDSQFIEVRIKKGKQEVALSSWHEVAEERGGYADELGIHANVPVSRLDSLHENSKDYLFFLFVWNDTRNRITRLIPVESAPCDGMTLYKDRQLFWQDGKDSRPRES